MAYLYFFGLVLGVGLGVPIVAFGAAFGMGRAISAALEGSARQPEHHGRLFIMMMVGLAFIETLAIYAILVWATLQGRLPATDDIMQLLRGGG